MIFIYLLVGFGGYAIGRIGHIYGGHLKSPHHWIYGVVAIAAGLVYVDRILGPYLIAFGIGHTFSDLKDMWELKFYGADPPGKKKFWGID